MKRRYLSLSAALLSALLLCGCEYDNTPGGGNGGAADKPALALVTCEGNYTQGNASISAILTDRTIYNEAFKKANNAPLGDIAQSLTQVENRLFAPLSNSAKVEVIAYPTYKSTASIPVGDNPQYLVAFDDSLALLSHLNQNYLTLLNTDRLAVSRTVPLPGSATYNVGPLTELNGKLYFVKDQEIVAVSLDASHTFATETIACSLLFNARLCADRNGKLWGIGYETFPPQEGDAQWDVYSYATLVCIDPVQKTVVGSYRLSENHRVNYYSRALTIDGDGKTLYLCAQKEGKQAIYRFRINETAFDAEPMTDLAAAGVVTPYNMAVSPDGNLFVTDALDYTQNGRVYEFSPEGRLSHQYAVGIAPQYLLFPHAR